MKDSALRTKKYWRIHCWYSWCIECIHLCYLTKKAHLKLVNAIVATSIIILHGTQFC